MSTGHFSPSPSSPVHQTETQLFNTRHTPTEEDEYERFMCSSPPLPEPHQPASPSDSAANQGQHWNDVIDPALSTVDPPSTVITRPGGLRNELAAARRLAECEKLLPYQRTALEEFTQVRINIFNISDIKCSLRV